MVENTYQRRGYWVQAISDQAGTVRFFSVTACDKKLTPRFARPGGPVIVLNRSTLSSSGIGGEAVYRPWTATGNSYFYETAYRGLDGFYKTFAWGLDNVCPRWDAYYEQLQELGVIRTDLLARRDLRTADPRLRRFRSAVVANTYGETDPFSDVRVVTKEFQIGVDRLLVRTVSPEYVP
jgi:hypothetical protein